jgi:hypothetical protein
MFGATPEVIRRHYEKLDQMKIAKQSVERHLSVVYEVAPDPSSVRYRRNGDGARPDLPGPCGAFTIGRPHTQNKNV